MKIVSFVARMLFILCLPLLFITVGLAIPGKSAWFYEYGFNLNHVGVTTGLDQSQLKVVAHDMVDYFNNNQKYINVVVTKDGQPFVLFKEIEILHLHDVKGLFQLDFHVLLGTAAFAILYAAFYLSRGRRSRPLLAHSVALGSGLTLVLMAALGVGIAFDFNQLLLDFHLISFTNDYWILNPAQDYLIRLIPDGFMVYGTIVAAGATALCAIVLGGVCWGYLWFSRHRPGSEYPSE